MAEDQESIELGMAEPEREVNFEQASSLPQKVRMTVPDQQTALAECPTNLPLDTFEGKALLVNCGNPGEIELAVGQPISIIVRWFAIFPDSQVDEQTGEIKLFTRACFVTPDGKIFRTTAAHAPKRIAAMLSLFGKEDWDKGLPITITARPSKRAGRSAWHEIRVGNR